MIKVNIKTKKMIVKKEFILSDSEIKLLTIINRNNIDSLVKEMYGDVKTNKYKQRIYQTISRLRNKGVDIETRKGIGYRLKNARFEK